MALEPLRIIKTWFGNNTLIPAMLDEIANKIGSYASRSNANFKQLGLDINGAEYEYNNTGVATQASSIISRLNAIEVSEPGFKNLGLDLSDTSIIKVVAADGDDLSATNAGVVLVNDGSNVGQILSRSVTANIEVELTGAHWGLDTADDQTDVPLHLYLIDNGEIFVLGISMQGGRQFILAADTTTTNTSVDSIEKIFVSTTISSDANIAYMGWVYANFDTTGNAGGENFWTVQTGKGDVNIGLSEGQFEKTVIRF